jgi:hypothetical protein
VIKDSVSDPWLAVAVCFWFMSCEMRKWIHSSQWLEYSRHSKSTAVSFHTLEDYFWLVSVNNLVSMRTRCRSMMQWRKQPLHADRGTASSVRVCRCSWKVALFRNSGVRGFKSCLSLKGILIIIYSFLYIMTKHNHFYVCCYNIHYLSFFYTLISVF